MLARWILSQPPSPNTSGVSPVNASFLPASMGVPCRVFSSVKQSLLRNPNPNPNPNFISIARFFSSLSSEPPETLPNPSTSRSKTPLERQFDTWIDRLRPGFTSSDVDAALRSIPDPDLALDVFRWTALRPGYRHGPDAYHTMLHISSSSRRFPHAEVLVDEILSGACDPDLPLYNTAIRFCCSRRHLFSRAFDLFKRMQSRPSHARPSIETYTMLLGSILRRFSKPPVSYVYLRSVRSLVRQMKASGVIPDTLALNHIIKAFSKCLEMDEALRVFKEMGLYGCEPNEYSYGYISKGLCEKGRVAQGFKYFKEMREKALVPTSSVYMTIICSLALEGKFEEGIEVVFDMLGNSMSPDILTYRTLLEGLCRDGRSDEAFTLLEQLGGRPGAMSRMTYSDLLDGLHWLCQPHD